MAPSNKPLANKKSFFTMCYILILD